LRVAKAWNVTQEKGFSSRMEAEDEAQHPWRERVIWCALSSGAWYWSVQRRVKTRSILLPRRARPLLPERQRQLPITTPIADVSVRTEWYLRSKIESPAYLVDRARMARATVASRVPRTQIRLSGHRGKSDHFLRT
jgi:hypothetical protein